MWKKQICGKSSYGKENLKKKILKKSRIIKRKSQEDAKKEQKMFKWGCKV